MNKKYVRFVADETTGQPHEEEGHITGTLKNLVNNVTSDATSFTSLTTANAKLVEQNSR